MNPIYSTILQTIQRFKLATLLILISYIINSYEITWLDKVEIVDKIINMDRMWSPALWSVLVILYFENRKSHALYQIFGLLLFFPVYYLNMNIESLTSPKLAIAVLIAPFIYRKTDAINIFSFQYQLIRNTFIALVLAWLFMLGMFCLFNLMNPPSNTWAQIPPNIVMYYLLNILFLLVGPIIGLICIPVNLKNQEQPILNDKSYITSLDITICFCFLFCIVGVLYAVKALYSQKLEHLNTIIFYTNTFGVVGIITYWASYCINDNKLCLAFKTWFFPLFLIPLCLLWTALFVEIHPSNIQKIYDNRLSLLIPIWLTISTLGSFIANKDNKLKYVTAGFILAVFLI